MVAVLFPGQRRLSVLLDAGELIGGERAAVVRVMGEPGRADECLFGGPGISVVCVLFKLAREVRVVAVLFPGQRRLSVLLDAGELIGGQRGPDFFPRVGHRCEFVRKPMLAVVLPVQRRLMVGVDARVLFGSQGAGCGGLHQVC